MTQLQTCYLQICFRSFMHSIFHRTFIVTEFRTIRIWGFIILCLQKCSSGRKAETEGLALGVGVTRFSLLRYINWETCGGLGGCSFLILSLIGVEIVYYQSVLISLNPEYRPRIHMENIKELANNVLPCLIFCLTLGFDRTEQEPGIALMIILTRMWPQSPPLKFNSLCGFGIVSYMNLKNSARC